MALLHSRLHGAWLRLQGAPSAPALPPQSHTHVHNAIGRKEYQSASRLTFRVQQHGTQSEDNCLSLTEPAGLSPSSLARMTFDVLPGSRCSRTSGVRPTCIGARWCGNLRRYLMQLVPSGGPRDPAEASK